MGYLDFIPFLISEVDKESDQAIEYWFRALDLDGDGKISIHEIECFFASQLDRMQAYSQELVLFEDVLCQLIDMIHPDNGYPPPPPFFQTKPPFFFIAPLSLFSCLLYTY